MRNFHVALRAATIAFILGLLLGGAPLPFAKEGVGVAVISPEKVADYVHAVLEADRSIYTTLVVDRMQEKGIVPAAEHWEQDNALPFPPSFFSIPDGW